MSAANPRKNYAAPDLSLLDAQSPYTPDQLEYSDIDLVALARNGQAEGFSGLYRRHYGAMLAFAWQYSRGKEQAEDIASEAMTSVMSALKAGKGPNVAIRAYLLTAVRNAATKTAKYNSRYIYTDDTAQLETASEEADPVVAKFENGAVARAFAGLPQRWQHALWYLDVENVTPAVAGAALKMRPNAVSALAKRAREGMRRAYMQEHVAQHASEECKPFASLLATYAQGGLGKVQRNKVREHLDECHSCSDAYAEIIGMQRTLGLGLPLGATAAGVFALVAAISAKDVLMPAATWAAVAKAGAHTGNAAIANTATTAGGKGSAGSTASSTAGAAGVTNIVAITVGAVGALALTVGGIALINTESPRTTKTATSSTSSSAPHSSTVTDASAVPVPAAKSVMPLPSVPGSSTLIPKTTHAVPSAATPSATNEPSTQIPASTTNTGFCISASSAATAAYKMCRGSWSDKYPASYAVRFIAQRDQLKVATSDTYIFVNAYKKGTKARKHYRMDGIFSRYITKHKAGTPVVTSDFVQTSKQKWRSKSAIKSTDVNVLVSGVCSGGGCWVYLGNADGTKIYSAVAIVQTVSISTDVAK